MTDPIVVTTPHHRLPRLLWIILTVGAAAGVLSVVVGAQAADNAADRAHQQSEANGRFLQTQGEHLAQMDRSQRCIVALLLIRPENRDSLRQEEIDAICPPVRMFTFPTTTTATTTRAVPPSTASTPPVRRNGAGTTAITRRPTTTTRRNPTTTTPTTNPMTTTRPPPSTTTTACQVAIAGRCVVVG